MNSFSLCRSVARRPNHHPRPGFPQEFKHLRRQHLLHDDSVAEQTAMRGLYLETYDSERNPFAVRLDSTVDEDMINNELVRTSLVLLLPVGDVYGS